MNGQRVTSTKAKLLRPIDRILYTYGEHHVDRVARDCLDRRLDAKTTALRLLVAADLAAVIDVEDWSARERGRR